MTTCAIYTVTATAGAGKSTAHLTSELVVSRTGQT